MPLVRSVVAEFSVFINMRKPLFCFHFLKNNFDGYTQTFYLYVFMCTYIWYVFFSNSTKQLTQFWLCLPGDSLRSHRLRAQSRKTAPLQRPVTSSGCCLCFLVARYKMRVPKTVSFGSVNLLEGSGRNVYLYLLVYHKKNIYCNLDEEVHRARPRKVQSAGTSVAMALGCTTLLAPARKLISSYCSRVFTVLNLLQHPPSPSPRS